MIRTIRHISAILLCAVLALAGFSSYGIAAERTRVSDIRFWSFPEYTRVVVTMSDLPEFTQNRLSNPDRLYFDIKNSHIPKELKTTLPVGNGMLKSIRASQFNESTVRVVLDLEKVRDYKVLTMDDPVRLVVDIYGGQESAQAPPVRTKKRIVIDPGHGGHDPGAIGPNKLYEKDVVLDIGLKLRKILSADPNVEVFMTRDKDVFIPLEQRTAIANSKKADLFVSIHANASPRKNAKGIETYFLNWTNDEEANKVAARENQISFKKMKKMNDERNTLDIILGSLSRDSKRDESLKLANHIQLSMIRNLHKEYSHIVDLGVKQALFYVLFGAEMSSVLVEVSFISNPLEEKLLSRSEYREDLAKSIAGGINTYVSASLPAPARAYAHVPAGNGKTIASRH
ncbi:MAG: N-acetylmuramoyl-L-alanine amidase [Nitrospiraceae bacterium]|nr:N-acetylmuramoyl-L-alanine amidase [Nitrospiraceae bacterium]